MQETYTLIQADNSIRPIELKELVEGSIIKISFKTKDPNETNEFMYEMCERDERKIKILAKTGLLIAISSYRDINQFDKWCTIDTLNKDIQYSLVRGFNYSDLKDVELF